MFRHPSHIFHHAFALAGPIFDEIRRISGALPYEDRVGADDNDGKDMAYRVVADHIRTLCFAIADGAQVGITPNSASRNDGARMLCGQLLEEFASS